MYNFKARYTNIFVTLGTRGTRTFKSVLNILFFQRVMKFIKSHPAFLVREKVRENTRCVPAITNINMILQGFLLILHISISKRVFLRTLSLLDDYI